MSSINDDRALEGHIDELAELYSLGALEPDERADVEAHVAGCSSCARALGDAEAAVAALDDAFVAQIEPPERLGARIAASAKTSMPVARSRSARASFRLPSFYATAAALLLAAGVGAGALVERAADTRQAAHDSTVLATIATSHFNHVTLTARSPAAPVSKVLYARDGAWIYVVIDGTTCDCRVVLRSSAGERDLGHPAVRGSTATLFVTNLSRPTSIELVTESGQIVSSATLIYASR